MVVTPDLWSHGISGNFSTASDWSVGVPGFSNSAEITANGTYTVTVNSTNGVEVNSLITAAHATLAIAQGTFIAYDGTGNGLSAGTIAVGNNGIFEIGGSTAGATPIEFEAPGVITLNSTGSPTTLALNGSTSDHTVQLSGGGKLILSDNAGNRIVGFGALPIFLNNNIIKGAGTIGNLDLQNAGTINADDGVPLIVNGGPSAVNGGTIECTSTGGLDLVNTDMNNLLGTIETTVAGAHIDLFETQIIRGDVSAVAGSSIVSKSGSFDNEIDVDSLTNAGNIVIQSNSLLTLGASANVANSGNIVLNASGGLAARLLVAATLDLAGNGKVTLSNNPQNFIASDGGGSVLRNQSNTISGAGTIGDADLTLEQGVAGVIDATGTNPLIIAATGATFDNSGKLEASGTGGLQLLHVIVNNSGVVKTTAAGAHIDLAGSTIDNGVLQIVAGSTLDSAVIGSNPTTSILSPTTFNNAGTLLVNLGTIMELDTSINNAGTVVIDSTLDISGNVLLSGAGKVEMTAGVIEGTSNLTNVSNTITGSGVIGTPGLSLTNDAQGVIDATGGPNNFLVVDASTTFNDGKMEDTGAGGLELLNVTTNDGVIESDGTGGVLLSSVDNNGKLVAESGFLSIQGLSGNGALIIGGSGEIEFGSSATGITPNVTFAAGATGTLAFAAPATTTPTSIYSGTISGFGTGDAIDLGGLSYFSTVSSVGAPVFSAVTHDTTVTVTNGTDTVTLSFAGNLTGHKFLAGDDGDGGTRVTDPVARPAAAVTLAGTAKPPPSLINVTGASNAALLGSYMASTFASAEGSVTATSVEAVHSQTLVAHPHSL